MAKSANQKQKLLHLRRMLEQETDERHGLSIDEIRARLELLGITAERKSIYDDLKALEDFGLDIRMHRGKRFDYYLAARDFEPAELRLLIDAVQVAKPLTEEKSRALIRKLKSLTGIYEAERMQRQVYVAERGKTRSEDAYESIDDIHTAIAEDKQVRFRYFRLTAHGRRWRRGGAYYHVSPWALIWQDERYYLIGYDRERSERRNFRVDKIADLTCIEEPQEGKDLRANFDPVAYVNQAFAMFDGTPESIKLKIDESVIGVALDRFGEETMLIPADGGAMLNVNVIASPQFFSWVCGLGGAVEIVSPARVRDEFCTYVRHILEKHEG